MDLQVLRKFCERKGEEIAYHKGDQLEREGEPAQWVVFVDRGCFKYMVYNDEEGKNYCTGFSYYGEFVDDSLTFLIMETGHWFLLGNRSTTCPCILGKIYRNMK